MSDSLRAEEEYLAELVEAIQRCAYFLDGSIGRLSSTRIFNKHINVLAVKIR